MQNQLQSLIELAHHLCIDWLIAAMGSVCHESQYNISYDHLNNVGFLPGRVCTTILIALLVLGDTDSIQKIV